MSDTPGRLLRLLSLLQQRRHWTGDELAGRLEVTTRTVRRDVDRLRNLGYPVEAAPGVSGGYVLGAGGDLPPLLLDDDEATAIAVALRLSARGAVTGIEQPALAALAKLDRLLPPRLRTRVAALRTATVDLGGFGSSGGVDADVLVELAQACDGHERVRLGYRARDGMESERRIEPHRLVAAGSRWYLVAYDLDRQDWRTFRVDRVGAVERTGHRFTPTDPPDAAVLVGEAITSAPYRLRAEVRVFAPADVVAQRVPSTIAVVAPDPADPTVTIMTTGADDLDWFAGHLVGMGLPFEALAPPELRDHLAALGRALVEAHAPNAG